MGNDSRPTPATISQGSEDPLRASALVRDGVITNEEYTSALNRSEQSGYSIWRALRDINFIFLGRTGRRERSTTEDDSAAGESSVPSSDQSGMAIGTFADLSDSDSIPTLVSNLFEDATRWRATDIHLDPTTEGVKIRARIDGLLHEVGSLPDELALHVRSRIKVLAGMDLVEKRAPQDGHIHLQTEQGHRDFRVATILTRLGERMVMRLHQVADQGQSLDALGLEDDQVATVRRFLARPQGLILIAGPIGSGKTTTLYACLRAMNIPERSLITIEDPIEYDLDGVTQVEVRPSLGLNFARGLRAILRQDPNVIMVGEIRDGDTARTASRAAATGALVFSSVHAADGYGVLRSLTNFRVPPHRIGESLAGIIVQRLVRTLCVSCKRPIPPDSTSTSVLADIGLTAAEADRVTLFEPTGCSHCCGTGFRGRTGVFEVIDLGKPGWDHSAHGRGETRWSHALFAGRSCDILRAAGRKVAEGVTTIDEVRRVIPAKHDVPLGPPADVPKPARDEAIRLGAYMKWEAAGKPEGDGVNFWLDAEKELLRP